MKEYVLGFMFSADRHQVVLIKKQKPAWQAGFSNGIGGKIEPLEDPIVAMVREFYEETGYLTHVADWRRFAEMFRKGDWAVQCYVMVADAVDISHLHLTTADNGFELVIVWDVDDVRDRMFNFGSLTLSNVPWLIDLALDGLGNDDPFSVPYYAKIEYRSKGKREGVDE